MSQSNKSSEHFGWKVYKNSPASMRVKFLRELNLDTNLPLVTWQGQVDMLDGAPDRVILAYLPKVYWKAQAVLFDKHLSAGSLPEAEKHLDTLAKRQLKLVTPQTKVSYRRWEYNR